MLVNGNQAKEALVAVGASVHYSYNKIGLCYSHPVLGEGKIGIIRWVAPDILSEEEVTEHLYILCFQKSNFPHEVCMTSIEGIFSSEDM